MPSVAALYLAGREWLAPAAVAAGICFVLVAASYFRTPGPRGLRLVCAALKLTGLAALLACLLEPMWSEQRAKPGANQLAIVADNSQSMTLRDRGAGESRGEALRRILTGERNLWRTQLAGNFDVRNYRAGVRLQQTPDFHDLAFDERSSALGALRPATLTNSHTPRSTTRRYTTGPRIRRRSGVSGGLSRAPFGAARRGGDAAGPGCVHTHRARGDASTGRRGGPPPNGG